MAFLWTLVAAAYLTLLGTVLGCGVPSIRPNLRDTERIVNGQNAVSGSWPWQVSLQTSSGAHFCGGSLINENWVATAAHCNLSPSLHVVVLGEYDRSSSAEPVQVKRISKAITHPSWDSRTLNNDITLLKLSSPVQLNSRVSPVCLASATEVLPEGLKCVTTGWGRTSSLTNNPAVKLQQVALPLVTVSQCQRHWGNRITSAMVCAGGAGASSCQGDSGGPLVCLKGSVWNLIGIVSWGTTNCNVQTPAVYTRVSQFRSWIEQVIARN
ncbi:chymotrypsin-like protease CTRL-1 [Heteronotia binoei]|uniref:chymotrypsin-like protease CTRL-1 n=1 Tax=Heteronotia binoei TaxID=13085 RepID=UPI0029301496|nr:chymotrypsin-like protease CTRL-1 [Heteronotia binoei]